MATPNEADDDLNKATSETGGNGENVASINLDCPNSPIDAEDRIVDLSLLEVLCFAKTICVNLKHISSS